MKLRLVDIHCTKTFPSGAYQCFARVGDFPSRSYFFYTKREAIRLYRDEMNAR